MQDTLEKGAVWCSPVLSHCGLVRRGGLLVAQLGLLLPTLGVLARRLEVPLAHGPVERGQPDRARDDAEQAQSQVSITSADITEVRSRRVSLAGSMARSSGRVSATISPGSHLPPSW